MGRRIKALLCGGVLLLSAFSCRSLPPSAPPLLIPHYHLLDEAHDGKAVATFPTATIREETRYVLFSSSPLLLVLQEAVPVRTPHEEVALYIPPEITTGDDVLLEVALRLAVGEWREQPPWIARPKPPNEGGWISLPLTFAPHQVGEKYGLRVRGRRVTYTPFHRYQSGSLYLPAEASLQFGLGIEEAGWTSGAPSVRFRVSALVEGERLPLFYRILDSAENPDHRRWFDAEVDLAAYRGKTLNLLFETEVDAPKASLLYSFPVWSNPTVFTRRPRQEKEKNVLLISLDTLRADRLGCYGYAHKTSPALDRLAATGTLFETAISQYPSTTASHMTLFTSLYPSVHEVRGPEKLLPAELHTLAEIMRARGYETGAVTEDGMLVGTHGFQRGFNFYHERKGISVWLPPSNAHKTVRTGMQWIKRHRNKKFLLFLHTYEIHDWGPLHTADTPDDIHDRYDGKVRTVDNELAKLFRALEAWGLSRDTLIIVTSDHGEALDEHNWIGHTWTAYDEVLKVPLILRCPGLIPAGGRISTQVALIDLMPTLLELLGLPPAAQAQGESFAHLIKRGKRGASHKRVVFSETWLLKGDVRLFVARTDRYKWIMHRSPDGTTYEVYDLTSDPGEEMNLDQKNPRLRKEGKRLINTYRRMCRTDKTRLLSPQRRAEGDIDEQTLERLRSLGYVQ